MKALMPTILTLSLLISALSTSAQVTSYPTKEAPLPCVDKTFSVVVHILRDTFGNLNVNTANISERFQELNEAFEPICVDFEICETRIIDNFQYDNLIGNDLWEELLVKEHIPNRINVFLVNLTSLSNPREGGFATPSGITETETGGIVWVKDFSNDSNLHLVHLMGHYFGLVHTFETPGELVDESNCTTTGDLICDTPADPYSAPADPYLAGYLSDDFPCRFIWGNQDANGEYYRPDVGNFMSYYSRCWCDFTREQFIKMANTYLDSSPKMW